MANCRVLLARRARRVPQVSRAPLAPRVLRAPKARRVFRVFKARRVRLAPKDRRDPLVHLVKMAKAHIKPQPMAVTLARKRH